MYNRKIFFDGMRDFLRGLGKNMTQSRVNGLEFLITSFEKEPKWGDVRDTAYALATIAHETAWTFHPIKEYRAKAGTAGRRNQDRYWLSGYYGRGYVQITWEANYRKLGNKIGVNLVANPNKALEPIIAFKIITFGMHEGLFTGKRLGHYISGTKTNYVGARAIVNPGDKANTIANYAKQIERVLRDARQQPNSTTKVDVMVESEPSNAELAVEIEKEVQSESGAPATEVRHSETTHTEEGAITQTVEQKNEQDVNTSAKVENYRAYNGIGFTATIKRDFAAIGVGNFTFQGLSEYFSAASGWPEWLVNIIIKAAIIVAVLSATWFIYRLISYSWFRISEMSRVKTEVMAKTDTSRKDVEWV